MPLKYLSNSWRILHIPSTNCEVSLTLTWSGNCVITSRTYREAVAGNNPVAEINNPTNAAFKIKDTKILVTLSAENDKKLLEQLEIGFKRTITWNEYRSEMPNQTITNNLNYLIDPTSTNVNGLFVL